MKKYVVLLFLVGMMVAGGFGRIQAAGEVDASRVHPVDPQTPYHHWVTLCAHNSYSSRAYGYAYAQQRLSFTEQIKLGARSFMPDTFLVPGVDTPGQKDILLCHGSCKYTRLFRVLHKPIEFVKGIFTAQLSSGERLADYLGEAVHALNNDPSLILTFIFEDYAKNPAIFDQILEESGIAPYILTKQDWDPQEKCGWPTLGWMQENSKRVVMFIDQKEYESSPYLRYEWHDIAENSFGTIDVDPVAGRPGLIEERASSRAAGQHHTRYLYLFNYFTHFPVAYWYAPHLRKFIAETVRYSRHTALNGEPLIEALHACMTRGLDDRVMYRGRFPNFIALDFIEKGFGIALVNVLNERYKATGDANLFRPLPAYASERESEKVPMSEERTDREVSLPAMSG